MADVPEDRIRELDPSNMFEAIASFSRHIEEALELVEDAPSFSRRKIERVVILGMGGSAIGGDLLRSFVASIPENEGPPIVVNRDYEPPAIDKHDLLVVSSYSGNTEETLTAYDLAHEETDHILVLTTGGILGRSALTNEYPMITLPTGLQPRAALAFSFVPLLSVLAIESNLFGSKVKKEAKKGLKEAVDLVGKLTKEYAAGPNRSNTAYSIASTLHGTIPVVYSSGVGLDTVNLRWRGQIQENAKNLAFGNLLPEMNHNEINGWAHPSDLLGRLTPVFLRDSADHERTKKRIEITSKIIGKNATNPIECESIGKTQLARMLSLIHLGDWVSYWLALLNGVDPSPVPVIEQLKADLKD
jgi:glucose/mannose-6-phosphate isomerase